MRIAFFTRSRSVTSPGPAAARWSPEAKKIKRILRSNKKEYCEAKLRKNAYSIFHEVKVRDLAAVQRRPAGRAEHEIKKNKNA